MANHFFSINRGALLKPSSVATATSSTAGDDIELRLADAASLTKKDVNTLVEQLLVFINNKDNTTFPPL